MENIILDGTIASEEPWQPAGPQPKDGEWICNNCGNPVVGCTCR